MPEVIETTVYTFEELDERAQERARDWYREGIPYEDWHEFVFEDFERICEILGVGSQRAQCASTAVAPARNPASGFQGLRARATAPVSRAATAIGMARPMRSALMRLGMLDWLQSPTSFSRSSARTSMPSRPVSRIGDVTTTSTAWRFLSSETAIDISHRPPRPRTAFQRPCKISRDGSIASLRRSMTTRCRAMWWTKASLLTGTRSPGREADLGNGRNALSISDARPPTIESKSEIPNF